MAKVLVGVIVLDGIRLTGKTSLTFVNRKSSKSNIKGTVKSASRMFDFPGFKSTLEMKNWLSSKILFYLIEQEKHRNCASRI